MNQPKGSRSPWPIAITSFFILFFAGLVSFIIYASTQPVDLVRADYYEEEIRYQDQLDRVKRTGEIGLPVQITFDAPERCIWVQLPPTHATASTGSIHLYRPSDSRLDQILPLHADAQGRQRLDTRLLRSGLWKVRLTWTMSGQEFYADKTVVLPPVHRPS